MYIYIYLFKLAYNTLEDTGSPGSIYTEKLHKNIIKQHLIASKI